ncbi:MAG: hypothetical protein LUD68_03735 [Rikenellaceae bacterium]|nr:hypothetical protein [Rikenellaceae bacterium]
MRNLLLPVLLFLLPAAAAAQPPVTGLTNTRNLKIEDISRTNAGLTIDIRALPFPNQTFKVTSDTYIQIGERRILLEKCEGAEVELPLKAG